MQTRLKLHSPPPTRAECAGLPRPCPRFDCRHHLWTDTERRGRPHVSTIMDNTHSITPRTESCALDVVEQRPGITLTEIADIFSCTRERIRQVEARALRKLTVATKLAEWHELALLKWPRHRMIVSYPSNNDTGTVRVDWLVRGPWAPSTAHEIAAWVRGRDTPADCNGVTAEVYDASVHVLAFTGRT
jgi:hypothetical protein